jgi:hypothetical protein
MRTLFVLLVVVLLTVDVVACGGASSTHTNAAATGGDTVASVSASTARSSTTGGEPGSSEREFDETGGVVASAADRREVTAVVKRYYAAVAADDGAEACRLLYQPLAKSFDEDFSQVSGPRDLRGKTCIAVESKLFRHRRGRPTSDVAGIEVTGVRVLDGVAAVALLRSPTMPVGAISLRREGGIWAVDQMLGSSLH